MSRNKDSEYYVTLCRKLKKELKELKEMDEQNERLLSLHNHLMTIAIVLLDRAGGDMVITEADLDRVDKHAIRFFRKPGEEFILKARLVTDEIDPNNRWEEQSKPVEYEEW